LQGRTERKFHRIPLSFPVPENSNREMGRWWRLTRWEGCQFVKAFKLSKTFKEIAQYSPHTNIKQKHLPDDYTK